MKNKQIVKKEGLSLRLLGSLEIKLNGEALKGFDSNKARALLCYLAVTGKSHFRASLLSLFWGDMPETDAKANLRVVLSNLRKLVGDYLEITRQTIAFKPQKAYELDVEIFCQVLDPLPKNPDIKKLHQVIELYQDDFLLGFRVRDAPDFDDWLLLTRQWLRELSQVGIQALIDYYQKQGPGAYQEAIFYTQKYLRLEPWREEAHRQLMYLLARSGQPNAALKQYEICKTTLANALDLEPMLETKALYERIRNLGDQPRQHLPQIMHPLLGREKELETIIQNLSKTDCRLLSLIGLGGVGKSHLAIEAARLAAEQFLEGAYFISLASLEDPNLLTTALAQSLNLTLSSKEDAKKQVIDYLRDKELLLLLDNFEHIAEAAPVLSEVLANCLNIKCLVTSRARLNLAGEWLVELGALAYPSLDAGKTLAPEALESFAAIQLLRQNKTGPEKTSLCAEDYQALVRICHLVEGLPLALEIASAWQNSLSLPEIALEIEKDIAFLASNRRDLPTRHRSIWAVFERSWLLLSEAERLAYRKLAVFRGGFERTAAEALTQVSLQNLATFLDKSLLRYTADQRYEGHSLLWEFAEQKLAERPDLYEDSKNAHSQYFLQQIARTQAALIGAEQQAALQSLTKDMDNLRAAWQWALEQRDLALLLESIAALARFFDLRGWIEEGIQLFEQSIQKLKPIQENPEQTSLYPQLLAKLQNHLASFLEKKGLHQQAQTCLQSNKSLLEISSLDKSADYGYCQALLGIIASHLSDLAKAIEQLQASLLYLNQADSQLYFGWALYWLGGIYYEQGDYEAAEAAFQRSLRVRQALGDQSGAAMTRMGLGIAANAAGRYTEEIAHYQASYALLKSLDDKLGLAWVLMNWGEVLAIDLQEYDEAKALFEESLVICTALGNQSLGGYVLGNLGTVAYYQGRYLEAEQRLEAGLQQCQAAGDQVFLLHIIERLGRTYYAQGKKSKSEEAIRQGFEQALAAGAQPAVLRLLELSTSILIEEKAPP